MTLIKNNLRYLAYFIILALFLIVLILSLTPSLIYSQDESYIKIIEPNEGKRGDEIILDIFGGNFNPELISGVIIPGGIETEITGISPEEINVRVSISEDAPSGSRPVVVIQDRKLIKVLWDELTRLELEQQIEFIQAEIYKYTEEYGGSLIILEEGFRVIEEVPPTEEGEVPTIQLEVYEGPLYSEDDGACYYRIQAIITGNPAPTIEFSKDDSHGKLGPTRARVNLYSHDETYTLTITATNSEGEAADSITLEWGCDETQPQSVWDYWLIILILSVAIVGAILGISISYANKIRRRKKWHDRVKKEEPPKEYQLELKVKIPGIKGMIGAGWLPPSPDLRDYTEETPEISLMQNKLGIPSTKKAVPSLPPKVDLRKWCSKVENQGKLGSCTAHTAVGIVEYFEIRAYGKYIDGSRLFIYKTTRNLMRVTGDTGAHLRDAMKALVQYGIVPEKYWPYTDKKPDFDKEPSSFVYAAADNYEAIRYFCHDPMGANVPPKIVLINVKKHLARGIPSMFGFFGFDSFSQSDIKGGIPYPCPGERAKWGHAIVAVGYDDGKKIKNLKCGKKTKGALLIRNSWGTSWGNKGYGWLPYDYVTNNLALDFWSFLTMEWVDTKKFGT